MWLKVCYTFYDVKAVVSRSNTLSIVYKGETSRWKVRGLKICNSRSIINFCGIQLIKQNVSESDFDILKLQEKS